MSTKVAKGPREVWIEYRDVEKIPVWPDNPKDHDLGELGEAFRRFGYVDPLVIDERDGMLRAGHGRREKLIAMRAAGEPPPDGIKIVRGKWFAPVLRGVRFKDSGVAEGYALGSNRIGEGLWVNEALAKILAPYSAEQLVGTGFTADDRVSFIKLGGGGLRGGHTDPDEIPDAPAVPVVKVGELWQLGRHRLLCGETRDADNLRRLVAGRTLVLHHADPPYGMGKEAAGIENDNLYEEKLDAFQVEWWRAWLPHLSEVGSSYIWGQAPDLWRLWWRHLVEDKKLMQRNEIVWDKGSAFGMRSAGAHSYPVATERCLFLMRGQQFLGNQNKEDFWPGYEPLRAWLEAEREKVGWSNGDVNKITGTHMAGHWFTQSQFIPISAEHYAVLAKAAEGLGFVEDYDELFRRMFPEAKKGGNQHRRDLAAKLREERTYFDNTHDTMCDVWSFPRVAGEERFGHATPKPVAMVLRAIMSSSEEGDAVGVPFAGTGPEFIAGEQSGREVHGIEISPAYCDVVIQRWEAFSGGKARRLRG